MAHQGFVSGLTLYYLRQPYERRERKEAEVQRQHVGRTLELTLLMLRFPIGIRLHEKSPGWRGGRFLALAASGENKSSETLSWRMYGSDTPLTCV